MKNPGAIRSRILELAEQNGGTITPEIIVDDAKRKESPLYECFEHDADRGLYQYQLIQARQLIRTVRVEIRTIHQTVRPHYFVRDPEMPSDQQGYVAIPVLQNDETRARSAVVAELKRVTQALSRARDIASALELEDEIDAFLDQANGLIQRVQAA
jgi:hypothetical protein